MKQLNSTLQQARSAEYLALNLRRLILSCVVHAMNRHMAVQMNVLEPSNP